jgi:hypothetical protein
VIAAQPDHQVRATLFDEQCRRVCCWHQPTFFRHAVTTHSVEAAGSGGVP